MKRSPVPLKKGIFSDGMGTTILLEGCMIGILALIAYALGGQTMTFAVLSLTQLVHAYNVRSSRSVFREGLLKNHKMNLAFIIGLVLQIIVITVPSLADIFHTVPMTLRQWSITGILSLMPLLVVELQKRILNRS
jgi:P-type Ca2+ transporter type 2C